MMPIRHPELTERDKEFLHLLGKVGVLTFEQANRIYQGKKYHYRRVRTLKQRGYVTITGRYIRLSSLGAKSIGMEKFRPQPSTWRDWAQSGELFLGVKSWTQTSQREARALYGFGRDRLLFRGLLTGSLFDVENTYTLYLLNHAPKQQTLQLLANEMNKLHAAVGLDRAIVFCAQPEIMEKATAFFEAHLPNLKELFILPYPYGTFLLNEKDALCQRVKSHLPPGARPSPYSFAHWETEDAYYACLVYNDLVKRVHLKTYLLSPGKPVIVFCLDMQEEFFRSLYPAAKIISI